MCKHTHIPTYMCIYIHTYSCAHFGTHACKHTHTDECICVCLYVYTHIYRYAHVCVYLYVYVYTRPYIYMYFKLGICFRRAPSEVLLPCSAPASLRGKDVIIQNDTPPVNKSFWMVPWVHSLYVCFWDSRTELGALAASLGLARCSTVLRAIISVGYFSHPINLWFGMEFQSRHAEA